MSFHNFVVVLNKPTLMTRVNVNESRKEPVLAKALKFTIVIAVIGIMLCVLFMAFGI